MAAPAAVEALTHDSPVVMLQPDACCAWRRLAGGEETRCLVLAGCCFSTALGQACGSTESNRHVWLTLGDDAWMKWLDSAGCIIEHN